MSLPTAGANAKSRRVHGPFDPLIAKLGSRERLSLILNVSPRTLYRWQKGRLPSTDAQTNIDALCEAVELAPIFKSTKVVADKMARFRESFKKKLAQENAAQAKTRKPRHQNGAGVKRT
jgi:hypothetical protein